MRINVGWIFLTLGLGAVAYIGFEAFLHYHDLPTAICLFVLAVCGAAIFRLSYHRTVSSKGATYGK